MSADVAAVRTLVAWCPDWPVVASGVPVALPIAVVHANRVVACSPAARAEGVRRGLRRREAQGRCPEVVIVEQDPSRAARTFEPVAAAIEAAFTPRVEVLRPGACAFPTLGPSRYFGGDDALVARVRATVDAVLAELAPGAPPCAAGVADGPFAAALAARSERVVDPGGTPAFLAPLPASTLDRPDLVDLLERLGLRTLGDVAALPAADVLARFGPDGARAHRLARGLDERPLALREPPPDLVVSLELDPPAERVDAAAFAARALASELSERLSSRGLACTRIAIEAETEHGEQRCRVWRHDGPLTVGAMVERVRWQLDGWLTGTAAGRPTAGISLLRLVPDEVHPDDGRQLGFWGGGSAEEERAARALARVQGMLGPEAVATAVLGGGRSPAEQVVLVPWGEPREPARPDVRAATIDRDAARRRDPLAAASVAGDAAAPGLEGAVVGVGAEGLAGTPAAARAATAARRRRERGRHAPPPGASSLELPPWPGRIPAPSPAVVPPEPVPVELVDAGGRAVRVSGRGAASAAPARMRVDGGAWVDVDGWAGPWPADERWWDPVAHRRRARVQVALTSGAAHLLALEDGRWWLEATYG